MFTALRIGDYTEKARVSALQRGIEAIGGKVIWHPKNDLDSIRDILESRKIRFAFTHGAKERESAVRGFLKGHGIPLLITELGYFRRSADGSDPLGYTQLGIDRLCWTPARACDSSRFDALKIAVAARKKENPKGAVLILGQVPNDTQHWLSHQALSEWLSVRAGYYLGQRRKVYYRAHPKFYSLQLKAPVDKLDSLSVPLGEHLKLASRVITYNSTGGLEALCHGLPVECHTSAHYAQVARGTRDEILAHFHKLAWSQWTIQELEDGTALKFMEEFLP